MKTRVKKLQDNDLDWYWIPEGLVEEFESLVDYIFGKEYLDCPEKFDQLIDEFDQYATDGCPYDTPKAYEDYDYIYFI